MESNRILRTVARAWLLTAVIFIVAPAVAGEFDPRYVDDFSSASTLARWSIAGGSWQFLNQEFANSSTNALSLATVDTYDPQLLPLDTIGGDLSLEVFFAIGSSGATARAGAVFEFADVNNFHEVTLSATGSLQLRSRIAGATRVVATATVPAPGANKWVHLSLLRRGNHTTVAIDGVLALDNVLQEGLQSGDVGLITRNASARFDDFDAQSFGSKDPYRENFNSGTADGWRPLSGTWSAASKSYVNSAVIQTAITQGPLSEMWGVGEAPFDLPYTFKVRMLNPYGASGNLVGVAWVQDASNYTEAVFSPTGEARLNRVANGVRTTLAAARYLGGGAHRAFDVEVENDGDQPQMITRVKVNGTTVFDMAPNVREGELSLITHWAPGSFDDIGASPRFFRPLFADFDDGRASQFPRPESWQIVNGVMNSNDVLVQDRMIIDPAFGWHELADIELRAKLVNRFGSSGNRVGLTYGEHGSVYYEAVFSPTGVASLRKVVKGVPTTLATHSYAGGAQNVAFEVQLFQIGDRTTVKVNGVAIFQNVLQPEAVGGGLGFVSHWSRVRVDDVSLTRVAETRYRLTALPNLPNPFGPRSFVDALNDRGEAVGLSRQSNGLGTAVLWRNGAVTPLGAGNNSEAFGINDKTEIVGTNEVQHGFFWKSGTTTDLGAAPNLPEARSDARDINEHGQIAGGSCDVDPCPAQLWQPDHTIVLLEDLPGGIVFGDAFAINEAGEAVGQSVGTEGHFTGVSWREGTVEELPGIGTGAIDINDHGQIVGFAAVPRQRGATWIDHNLVALPVLPILTDGQARGINEHASIVGWNVRPNADTNTAHAVIWQDGNVGDLNQRVVCGTLPASILLDRAEDINELGQIAVDAIDRQAAPASSERAYILTPVSVREPCN